MAEKEMGAAVKNIWPLGYGKTLPSLDNYKQSMIDVLIEICNRIWRTGECPTPWTQSLIITLPKRATCSSARTTEVTVSSVIRAKSC